MTQWATVWILLLHCSDQSQIPSDYWIELSAVFLAQLFTNGPLHRQENTAIPYWLLYWVTTEFKGIVHPNMKTLSRITLPQVVSNPNKDIRINVINWDIWGPFDYPRNLSRFYITLYIQVWNFLIHDRIFIFEYHFKVCVFLTVLKVFCLCKRQSKIHLRHPIKLIVANNIFRCKTLWSNSTQAFDTLISELPTNSMILQTSFTLLMWFTHMQLLL